RRLLVIVAAPLEDVPFDACNSHVDRWTKQTVGLAHVASLDPLAAQEFEHRHGIHAVRAGTFQTYPAGVDLDDPLTAKTARWLGHQSLAGDDRDVERTIESFVRQHSISQPIPLPSESREWARAFERIAGTKLRESVSPSAPAPTERRIRLAERKRITGTLIPSAPITGAPEPAAPPTSSADARDAEVEVLLSRIRELETRAEAAEQKLKWVQDTLLLDDLGGDSLNDLLDEATREVPVANQEAIDTLLSTNEALQSRLEALDEELVIEQIEKAEARNAVSLLEEGGVNASKQHGARRPVVGRRILSGSGSRVGGGGGC